jgi:hypothetical protein
MPRASIVLAAVAFAAVLCGQASASEYHYGFDNDDPKDKLAWAIVRDGRNSSSDLQSDEIGDIQDRYGKEFLYIRDHDGRWVIRDRAMMRRAEGSLKPIEEAGREIGQAVGAKVSYSLSRSEGSRERARLERKISRLETRIQRLRERREDTEELESRRLELKAELEQLKSDRRQRHDSEEREAELEAATERASRHMRDATRKLNKELRDILRDARARNLAEAVED